MRGLPVFGNLEYGARKYILEIRIGSACSGRDAGQEVANGPGQGEWNNCCAFENVVVMHSFSGFSTATDRKRGKELLEKAA